MKTRVQSVWIRDGRSVALNFCILRLVRHSCILFVFNGSICAGLMVAGDDSNPFVMPWHDAEGIVLHCCLQFFQTRFIFVLEACGAW